MDSLMIENLTTLKDLIAKQIDFQVRLGNHIPDSFISFENVRMSLEHNIYQQIEFQEFMEADKYDKKEELVDYLLFMLNKYIFLGVKDIDGSIPSMLWDDSYSHSLALASSYADIEQSEFIKMVRKHCTFKPWKVRDSESCADIAHVYESFKISLECFRKLAGMVFDNYYDLHTCIIKKLMINIDRQNNHY